MKSFTLLKGFLSFFLVILFSGICSAQALTASPQNIMKPIGGPANNVTVALSTPAFGTTGNYNWTVSSPTGVTFSAATAGPTQNVTFSSAASGSYTFTVNRAGNTGPARSTVVTLCNILASVANDSTNANRGQWAGGFLANNGVLAASDNGQQNFFDWNLTNRVSAVAVNANGFIYSIENIADNNGLITVQARTANGSTTTNVITNADMNLTATTDLDLVRLGVGADGTCWILAGDGTTVYLASFVTNGTTAATLSTPKVVTFAPGSIGSAATFVNGDLCLDANNRMLVLANNGAGQTIIYVINTPTAVSPQLQSRFQVNDNTNAAFTGTVNGVAFDVNGNAYMSSNDPDNVPQSGLYYINANTINFGTGTIQAQSVHDINGITDLGSNVWPAITILPVKLNTFTVVKQGNNAVLDWSTVTESNSDYFEVQRSTDGVNFVTVGTKDAAGTSNDQRSYQYSDPINTTAAVLYYRLNTVDIDQRASYSKIVSLKVNGGNIKNLTVFPNPFTTDLKLQVISEKEADITIRINNVLGQPVINRRLTLQKGENIIVLSSELKTLKPGTHLMEIITDEGKTTQQIIKQ
jgi:hypothetical protein